MHHASGMLCGLGLDLIDVTVLAWGKEGIGHVTVRGAGFRSASRNVPQKLIQRPVSR